MEGLMRTVAFGTSAAPSSSSFLLYVAGPADCSLYWEAFFLMMTSAFWTSALCCSGSTAMGAISV